MRFRRARAAPSWRRSLHAPWKGRHEREAAVPSAPARAPTCQPSLSSRKVACACSAHERHCARSLWGRGPARALPTRACAPLRALSLGTRPSFCASDARTRRAVLATLAPCTVEGHCTSEKPLFLRRQPVLPRASPAPHCARWLARLCARSLWGRGPAHALPTRARAAPSWRHSLHTLWKSTARARGRRSFGARPVLPRVSPAPHCAMWLARVARLRVSALTLSGDEAQHVRFRRARAAPR